LDPKSLGDELRQRFATSRFTMRQENAGLCRGKRLEPMQEIRLPGDVR
jgi:hypothetical protein